MKNQIDFIDSWKGRRVMVVGDFMLDRHVFGNAERLSPDAPVPVLSVEREEDRAGGAANVCILLSALKCQAVCVGLIGPDAEGRELRRQLEAADCDVSGLIEDPDRPTTLKTSLVGLAQHRHPQKMFRVDRESRKPVEGHAADRLLKAVMDSIGSVDVICIEDYNKGVLTEEFCQAVIRLARSGSVEVLVDPAAISDYSRYRGATAITPNRTEAQKATGLTIESQDEIEAAAGQMIQQVDLQAVVMTLDRHGALLLEKGARPVSVPTVARSVYDVTGAGDMVLAMLAGARANGADWKLAVELANTAAGLEVEKFGVAPIPIEEIQLYLLLRNRTQAGKMRTLEQLVSELKAYRGQGRKIGFTNGCFDILHAGHVDMLVSASKLADILVLAVNSDASIRRIKGPQRPIVHEDDRVKVLGALECVDYVIIFGDGSGGEADTPMPLLRELRPDVLIKGGDYAHDQVVGWEIVESYGGRVATIPPVQGRSTTNIVEKIRQQARAGVED